MERLQGVEGLGKGARADSARLQSTRSFPKEEMYGLTSQMRRASASIGANIAEGCGRRSDAEMGRFVQIARGIGERTGVPSAACERLAFLSRKILSDLDGETLEVERMLAASGTA